MTESTGSRTDTRSRIVAAAARLLQDGGPAAVTTRGVAEAAGVQAPAIYRLFGDKDGLLDAVAEHVMAEFVAAKAMHVRVASAAAVDPIDDLRAGWNAQIDFGLANPALFRLFGDPGRAVPSRAAQEGRRVLEARVRRVAATGRLRVGEQRAVGLIQAAGTGAVQTLLSSPPGQRDAGLADHLYEAVLAQILTDAPAAADRGPMASVVAVRAAAPRLEALTGAERQLLAEWLDRVVDDLSRDGR